MTTKTDIPSALQPAPKAEAKTLSSSEQLKRTPIRELKSKQQSVSIDLIETPRRNPRRVTGLDSASIAQLAMSIASIGLQQPLVLHSQPGGGYALVCGHRRLAALRLLNKQAAAMGHSRIPYARVPGVITRAATRLEWLTLACAENTSRTDMNIVEIGNAARELSELGLGQREIARRLGKTQGWVSRTYNVAVALGPKATDYYSQNYRRIGGSVHAAARLGTDETQLDYMRAAVARKTTPKRVPRQTTNQSVSGRAQELRQQLSQWPATAHRAAVLNALDYVLHDREDFPMGHLGLREV